ncbi:MAG: hypothetical protein DMF52_15145 [Acidobacteria bacterium]|nr:MAG: hypothetical protein DMF52_15145 [Acidobacteriota bacterium]
MRLAPGERMQVRPFFLDPELLHPQLGVGVELVEDGVVEEAIAGRLQIELQLLEVLVEGVTLVRRGLRDRSDEVEVELDLQLRDIGVDPANLFFDGQGRLSPFAAARPRAASRVRTRVNIEPDHGRIQKPDL